MAEFKESEHPRDKDGKFTDKGSTSKSRFKRLAESLKLTRLNYFGNSKGAISGALDSTSKRARKHAKKYYAFLRTTDSDIKPISKNTGYAENDIAKIKRYLFIDKHHLSEGYIRFYPDYDIAVSWQRLIQGKDIKPQDIVLLKHELEEMMYVEKGYSQQEAHKLANKKYNYQYLVLLEKKNGNTKKY